MTNAHSRPNVSTGTVAVVEFDCLFEDVKALGFVGECWFGLGMLRSLQSSLRKDCELAISPPPEVDQRWRNSEIGSAVSVMLASRKRRVNGCWMRGSVAVHWCSVTARLEDVVVRTLLMTPSMV